MKLVIRGLVILFAAMVVSLVLESYVPARWVQYFLGCAVGWTTERYKPWRRLMSMRRYRKWLREQDDKRPGGPFRGGGASGTWRTWVQVSHNVWRR